MIYTSTPDFYNDYIAHERSHKYVDKYKNASGRWVYVYTQPKLSDLPNPYESMNNGMNSLRTGASNLVKRGKKAAAKGAVKGVAGALNLNDRFNKYMNGKASAAGKKVAGSASSAYGSAKRRGSATINKTTSAAKKNASSLYNTAASKATKVYNKTASKVGEYADAYEKYSKKRKQVAAGKKLIKKHNIARRAQKRAESDNAVYYRALKEARKTIKTRKSK